MRCGEPLLLPWMMVRKRTIQLTATNSSFFVELDDLARRRVPHKNQAHFPSGTRDKTYSFRASLVVRDREAVDVSASTKKAPEVLHSVLHVYVIQGNGFTKPKHSAAHHRLAQNSSPHVQHICTAQAIRSVLPDTKAVTCDPWQALVPGTRSIVEKRNTLRPTGQTF